MSVSDELMLEIGDAIIQNLDEDGMLRASVEEIANLGPYPPEEVEKALAHRAGPRSRRAWPRAT